MHCIVHIGLTDQVNLVASPQTCNIIQLFEHSFKIYNGDGSKNSLENQAKLYLHDVI